MAYVEFKTNPTYVQGPNALIELRRYTYHLGTKFLIVTACGPQTEQVVATITKSFESSMTENLQKENVKLSRAFLMAQKFDAENKKPTYKFLDYEGKQVTRKHTAEIADAAKEMGADVIIGVGGGKALDLVRGAHHLTGAKIALCPTAAASNAAATTLNVVYNDDGSAVVGGEIMDYHPNLVLADTNLIIKAPVHMLIAGIGDCMCTYYESYTTFKESGTRYTVVDYAYESNEIAKKVFYEHGYAAVEAAKVGMINYSFESVVAQILHMSGPTSCATQMNFSHILDEALICFEPCRKVLHGYLVGYGVIPQMIYANEPMEELYRYVDFAKSIGLPVTMKDLGIENVTAEEFEEPARIAMNSTTYKMTTSKVKQEDFYRCIKIADKIVTDYLANK